MTDADKHRQRTGVAARLAQLALARHRLVLVAAAGVVLTAFIAWTNVARLESPNTEPHEILVSIAYPGGSPADVESHVVQVLEPLFRGLDAIEYVESTSLPSFCFFRMKFGDGVDMSSMVERARGVIASQKEELPAVLEPADVRKVGIDRVAQLLIAVTGYRSLSTLTLTARKLRDALVETSGVMSATLRGVPDRWLRVRADTARMALHHVSLTDLTQALSRGSARGGAGTVRIGSVDAVLEVDHEYRGADDVRASILQVTRSTRGAPRFLTVGQVAEVWEEEAGNSARFAVNRQPAVAVEVRFRPERNALEVGRSVRSVISTLELPNAVRLRLLHDQPAYIERFLGGFYESLLEGMALVVVVLSVGLGWRAGLVVATAIPLSIGAALVGLYANGFALEQVTLAGMTVAIGLLVDDAVVVTEAIQRFAEKGLSLAAASIAGTANVFWANNVTTAVACAAFTPLFFMGGNIGQFIRGLPAAVTLALLASLAVAQLFTPWLASHALRLSSVRKRPKDSVMMRALMRVQAKLAPAALDHSVLVVFAVIALTVAAVPLMSRLGVQFFPRVARDELFVSLEFPPGTATDHIAQRTSAVLQRIERVPGVVATSAVTAGAYPRIFLGRIPPVLGSNLGDVMVQLDPSARPADVARDLRHQLAHVGDARVRVEELWNGPPVSHPISIRLQGADRELLNRNADRITSWLRELSGVINIGSSNSGALPVIDVVVDDYEAARGGLPPARVASTLRAAYGGDSVVKVRRNEDVVRVLLEPVRSAVPLHAVMNTRAQTHAELPLSALTRFHPELVPSELRRRNLQQMVEVFADVDASVFASRVLSQVQKFLKARPVDSGVRLVFGGEHEETVNSFRRLGQAACAAAIIIGILMVMMFDDFKLTAVVLAGLPFGAVGPLVGLWLMNQPLGFMSVLGLLSLLGVYVNHKIYFIDRYQQLHRSGLNTRDALLEAGRQRLRPVVLTALTALLGLLPLTLSGDETWSAFGWANIFGLLASLPLSLLVLPACIMLVSPDRKWHRGTPQLEDGFSSSGTAESTG